MTEQEFRAELDKRDADWGQLATEAWQAWTDKERSAATVEDLVADVEDTLLSVEETRLADVPEDKIMIAVLDDSYYAENGSYPEEFSSKLVYEKFVFDKPEEFVKKWYELDEGAWYWVFVNGEEICSGAVDPGDIEIFEEHFDIKPLMDVNNKSSVLYRLTARSVWSDNVAQRASFVDETYGSLPEAMKGCREFRKGLASHMFPGIEEVRIKPNMKPVKTGAYWELVKGEFLRRIDMKTFEGWPDDLLITQYLQVGDMVDTAMYLHFLNETPPRYHTGNLYTGDVLQAGGPCDVAENKDGVLQPTYLTFVKDAENDCWIFKGECCPGELINRNPELEPVAENTVDKLIDNAKSRVENVQSADIEKEME